MTRVCTELARAGLVRVIRQGRERLYQLDPKRLEQAREYLDAIALQWDQALGRLKMLVKGE